jgi:hypothetical protein
MVAEIPPSTPRSNLAETAAGEGVGDLLLPLEQGSGWGLIKARLLWGKLNYLDPKVIGARDRLDQSTSDEGVMSSHGAARIRGR